MKKQKEKHVAFKVINTIGEAGCPCGEYEDENVRIDTHCWRVGNCCAYSGVHYIIKKNKRSAMKKVKEIAEHIHDSWMTEVNISNEPRE